MGFQTQVNVLPAPGVEGDFCSANPRASVLAGPGAFVAGPNGLLVGRFAWVDQGNYTFVNNSGQGTPDGFVHREQQALITVWLQEATMLVPSGIGVTLHQAGDFWVVNRGSAQAMPRMKAYALFGSGSVSFAATGNPPAGATVTGAVTASTGGSTASTIADNILTVGGTITGGYYPGATVTGTGVAAGTTITSQIDGTPGGAGHYNIAPRNQAIATPQAINCTYGTLNVTVAGSAPLQVGDQVTAGTGAVVGSTITAFLTGAGGVGTYVMNNSTAVASTAITFAGGIETKWYAMSYGMPGELVKMSSWPLG
jgi:hypothetical protein